MAVTDLLDEAEKVGIRFLLDGNRIAIKGDPVEVKRLAPRLRRHKNAVLIEIQKRQAGMYRVWVVRPPMREAFTVGCPQGATAEMMHAQWPGAEVEPQS